MSLEIDLNLHPRLPSFHCCLALSLHCATVPPLHRSAAGAVPCSVPHCCRDRSVQSGEWRLQSRDYRAESREQRVESRELRAKSAEYRAEVRRHRAETEAEIKAETGRQILKTQSDVMCSGGWGMK